MGLTSFTVANYRSFPRPTTLELRPLTLLFGYNNSGKSALLRVLPLLADSVGGPRGAPLNLDSPAVRGAAFRDLCCQLSPRRQIDFALKWKEGEAVGGVIEYRLSVLELPGPQAEILPPVVRGFELARSEEPLSIRADWLPVRERLPPGMASYEFQVAGQAAGTHALLFRGITPEPTVAPSDVSAFERSLDGLAMQLEYFEDEIYWLGAVRNVPERSMEFRGSAPPVIEPDGSGTLEILTQDKLLGGPLLASVSGWFEKYTRQRLDVTEVAPRYFALTLGPLASPGVRVNIVDTGEGMAQVLPVLTLGAQARAESNGEAILLLEQPELHLHPSLHAPLADYFCELAMLEKPPRTLIETHSENFLQGIQLSIVQGRLRPDRVGVYWVQQLDDGSSTVDLITFDDKGRPSHWPPGVFAEDTELARRILKERRAKEGP